MPEFFDSEGRRVQLGREIGRGGEGVVYSLTDDAARVGKIYHSRLAASRQEKLEAMVTLASSGLLEFACWPLTLLYSGRNRAFAGYIMSNLGQCQAVHELYNPKSRRASFPRATYKFLLHTAANISKAFAAAARSGIVIGDVNQNSVMVRADGIVKLIDCDSAQVSANGKVYRCEVGVPLFTPPELQGCEFSRVNRTEQHDAFGLAVLIFQLLCMGKHPFAGRYLLAGDMPIERAIAERRFPYYRGEKADFLPPPDSVDIRLLSPCSELFINAFLGKKRPDPFQWIDALSVLSKSLKSCAANPAHQFPAAATSCPWCAIETRTGAMLFAVTIVVAYGAAVDVDLLWSHITTVNGPPSAAAPVAGGWTVQPTAEAIARGKEKRQRRFLSIGACLVVCGLLALWQPYLFSLFFICIFVCEKWASQVTADLKRRRHSELTVALQRIDQIKRQWDVEASDKLFQGRLRELDTTRGRAKQLPQVRATKLKELQMRMRESQLKAYLDRFYIVNAGVQGIGPGRAATLSAFGIDTAADITASMQVQGIGPVYKNRLLDWRLKLERRFVFDPRKGVDPKDVNAIEQEFHREMNYCAGILEAGPRVLTEITNRVNARRVSLTQDYTAAFMERARAECDLKVL